MDSLLRVLLEEEDKIIFEKFDNDIALEIGNIIVEKAKQNNKKIVVQICKNRHLIFHYSLEGTSPDNNEWVRRKMEIVHRFFHSSYYIGQKLKSENKTIEEKYLIDRKEYAPFGGAFPINVKGVGIVGAIAISGMSQKEDHEMVVNTLKEYLNI